MHFVLKAVLAATSAIVSYEITNRLVVNRKKHRELGYRIQNDAAFMEGFKEGWDSCYNEPSIIYSHYLQFKGNM